MATRKSTPRSHHYSVYAIELSDQVWNVVRFREANRGYELGKPFVDVGMTGLDPDLRFDGHLAGNKAGRFSAPGAARTKLRLLEIEGAPLGGAGPGLFDSV